MSDSLWDRRLANSKKYFDAWHSLFKCNMLEEYYQGFQWKDRTTGAPIKSYNPYTINLFYSTIKIKLANLLFQKPTFVVSPRPGNSQWNLDFAVNSATIKQDTLNTIVQNPNTNFVNHVKLAALDSFFRYSIMEAGYAADWRNPQKEIPHLKSWDKEDVPEEKDKVIEDNTVPVNERFFVKRIQPQRFRVSLSDATDLQDHEWCGYYEFFYTRELQKTKGINWPKEAPESLTLGADYSTGVIGGDIAKDPEFRRMLANGSISKVWNIFDQVRHKRCLYLDSYTEEPLWEADMERLPLIDHRWDLRLEGWYPIPPAFQWITPQDEINEAREQTRSYRRRFTRKFQTVKGKVSEEEKEKFSSGPDGILIEVEVADAIQPISNPEQGPTAERALLLAKDDFNIISGTAAEARGPSDRETATASRIVDARSQIRESAEQMDFSVFMCRIGRELLACASEKLAEGLWIKMSKGPGEEVGTDMQTQPYFQYITAQDLSDGYDFDIDIDVRNATPAAMEQAKQSFMTFVAMIQNFPMLAMDPTLIRETAYRTGYRNEQVIRQMQQVAIAAMVAKQQMAGEQQQLAGGGGPQSSNAASTQVAQESSPDMAAIESQIANQIQ